MGANFKHQISTYTLGFFKVSRENLRAKPECGAPIET